MLPAPSHLSSRLKSKSPLPSQRRKPKSKAVLRAKPKLKLKSSCTRPPLLSSSKADFEVETFLPPPPPSPHKAQTILLRACIFHSIPTVLLPQRRSVGLFTILAWGPAASKTASAARAGDQQVMKTLGSIEPHSCSNRTTAQQLQSWRRRQASASTEVGRGSGSVCFAPLVMAWCKNCGSTGGSTGSLRERARGSQVAALDGWWENMPLVKTPSQAPRHRSQPCHQSWRHSTPCCVRRQYIRPIKKTSRGRRRQDSNQPSSIGVRGRCTKGKWTGFADTSRNNKRREKAGGNFAKNAEAWAACARNQRFAGRSRCSVGSH